MEKLIIAGKAKKVFSIIEAIARRHPDMPLSLYNGEDLKEFQFSIDCTEEIANEFSEEDVEQFIQKNIERKQFIQKNIERR